MQDKVDIDARCADNLVLHEVWYKPYFYDPTSILPANTNCNF